MDTRDGRIYIADPIKAEKRFRDLMELTAEDMQYIKPMKHHPTPTQRARRKVGRNDICPCGSGKKFKKCCLFGASGTRGIE